MKNALTLALLSFTVSQVMAVVPIPIKDCTKTVVVDPKYDACTDFARDYNITFKDLLQYNEKLRKDCMNLDTGEKMCVSINPGGINPPLVPKAKKEKATSAADADASPKDSKDDKKTKEGKAASEIVNPEHTQEVNSAAKATEKKENTPAAAGVVPVPANGANGATTPPTKQQQQPNAVVNAASVPVGATSSMLLAAAGVLLSVVYML